MPAPLNLTALGPKELLAVVLELQRQNTELAALGLKHQIRIEELLALLEMQQAEIERLRRAGQRQTAPFSKGTHKANPKKPGRKPGSGTFTYRQAPLPETITETLEAPVVETQCPCCGGALEVETVETATTTDIPLRIRPTVTAFRVQVCRCTKCGHKVRGEHPRLADDQYGATANRVGHQAMAIAHWLHYCEGVPLRKVPGILLQLTGLRITQSALTQDALRQAAGAVGKVYRQLRVGIKDSAFVHTDDTGWRVAGNNAHLMTFVNPETSVYQIRKQHRNEEVREVIPADYQGTMITDRGRSYDAREYERTRQGKCVSHLQRSIDAVIQKKKQRGEPAPPFCLKLKGLLKQANILWQMYHKSESWWFRHISYPLSRNKLMAQITDHLKEWELGDPDCQRLLNEMGRHHRRGNLVRFLTDPSIPPTNNAAERALRPAVIARKVSQCSKNESGAEAFSAFVSVLRTALKRGLDPVQVLHRLSSASDIRCLSP